MHAAREMLPGRHITRWAVFLWLPAIKHTHDVISVKFVSREIWPSHDKPTPIPHDIFDHRSRSSALAARQRFVPMFPVAVKYERRLVEPVENVVSSTFQP